jgi:AraC family transcriptional regulator, exoenzyme S synthesis regulatory protein ExsA
MFSKHMELAEREYIIFDNVPFARYKVDLKEGSKTVFVKNHMLVFVLKGKKQISFEDQSVIVDEHSLVLFKRGLYVISENLSQDHHFEALIIFVQNKFFKEFIYNHNLSIPVQKKTVNYFSIPNNELLNSFKIQYLSYFGKDLSNLKMILEVKLQELFLILTSNSFSLPVIEFINMAIKNEPTDLEYVIQKTLFQQLSLKELAEISGRSLASFKRDFQRLFNSPPKKWINQQRLVHAQVLLSNSSKNISEIAYASGFESASHFIRLFKKQFGFTPAEKRAEITTI